jgi:hypothetical protein
MRKRSLSGVIFLVLAGVACFPASGADLYHPDADPYSDLKSALARASAGHKKVIVQVGGNWCRWTRALDKLYQDNTAIAGLLQDKYELVRVNYSDENYNQEFITTLGATDGIPFIFILDNDGRVLHAQETGALEQGDGHDPVKVFQLYNDWK